MEPLKPRRGAVALCSIGRLGLITSDRAVQIQYQDGSEALAWTGIQLREAEADPRRGSIKEVGIGDPWSSRNPWVIGYIDGMISDLLALMDEDLREATAEKLAGM